MWCEVFLLNDTRPLNLSHYYGIFIAEEKPSRVSTYGDQPRPLGPLLLLLLRQSADAAVDVCGLAGGLSCAGQRALQTLHAAACAMVATRRASSA